MAPRRVPLRLLAVAAFVGVACGSSLRTVRKPTARALDDPLVPLRFPSVPNSVRHFLASACSGAAGVTCLAPVEILRLSFMSKGETFKGAVASLGAPKTWLRGNSADTLSTALKIGITMPTFALYKNAITTVCLVPEDAPTPRWAVFLAGALAGCTATCLCYPLDVVRMRMALELMQPRGNMVSCLASIGRTEGVRALYFGLPATVAGIIPFSSMKLATYDLLRRRLTEGVDAASVSVSLAQSAQIGAMAGIVAATSCFPFEVVRRRQMGGELTSLSVIGAMSAIANDEGLRALFKGVSINVFKVALSNSLGFALYENFKDVLQVDDRKPPWRRAPIAPMHQLDGARND